MTLRPSTTAIAGQAYAAGLPFVAAPITAVTIETTGLRAIVVRRGAVVAWASEPLPRGAVVGGRLADPAVVGERLRQLVRAYRLPTRRLVSCVSGFQAETRLLRLPPLPAAALEAAVRAEARRQLSLPPEAVSLAWQPIGRTAEASFVYLVAVPRDLLDGHLLAWHHAGLRLRTLDLKPLAVVRALGVRTGLVVNIESDSVDLTLVVDYRPEIVRTVPLPQVAGSASLGLDIVADEVYRTAKFYDDSHKEAPLDPAAPIILAGEVGDEAALRTAIAARSDRPVTLGTPPFAWPPSLATGSFVALAGLVAKHERPADRRTA